MNDPYAILNLLGDNCYKTHSKLTNQHARHARRRSASV